MKRNKSRHTPVFPLVIALILLQGCTADAYNDFSAPIITTAYLAFFMGIGSIWGTHKLLNIEKARSFLSSVSSAVKVISVISGVVALAIVIFGFVSDGLLFYNTYLGTILLFISSRLYQSAKSWEAENWENAKLNSKLIMYSISIFIAIGFLIYFGKRMLEF